MATGMQGLLTWCKIITEPYGDIGVKNMTTSWRDGLAFCAIIHHFRPDLIDFHKLSKENIAENNALAFGVAEDELGIPALLDVEDMVEMKVPDRLSILTYVSQYYNYFKNKIPGEYDLQKRSAKKHLAKEPIESAPPKREVENKLIPFKPILHEKKNSCSSCGETVYLMERLSIEGKLFHRICFQCTVCEKQLKTSTYEYEKYIGKFYCPEDYKCRKSNQTNVSKKQSLEDMEFTDSVISSEDISPFKRNETFIRQGIHPHPSPIDINVRTGDVIKSKEEREKAKTRKYLKLLFSKNKSKYSPQHDYTNPSYNQHLELSSYMNHLAEKKEDQAKSASTYVNVDVNYEDINNYTQEDNKTIKTTHEGNNNLEMLHDGEKMNLEKGAKKKLVLKLKKKKDKKVSTDKSSSNTSKKGSEKSEKDIVLIENVQETSKKCAINSDKVVKESSNIYDNINLCQVISCNKLQSSSIVDGQFEVSKLTSDIRGTNNEEHIYDTLPRCLLISEKTGKNPLSGGYQLTKYEIDTIKDDQIDSQESCLKGDGALVEDNRHIYENYSDTLKNAEREKIDSELDENIIDDSMEDCNDYDQTVAGKAKNLDTNIELTDDIRRNSVFQLNGSSCLHQNSDLAIDDMSFTNMSLATISRNNGIDNIKIPICISESIRLDNKLNVIIEESILPKSTPDQKAEDLLHTSKTAQANFQNLHQDILDICENVMENIKSMVSMNMDSNAFNDNISVNASSSLNEVSFDIEKYPDELDESNKQSAVIDVNEIDEEIIESNELLVTDDENVKVDLLRDINEVNNILVTDCKKDKKLSLHLGYKDDCVQTAKSSPVEHSYSDKSMSSNTKQNEMPIKHNMNEGISMLDGIQAYEDENNSFGKTEEERNVNADEIINVESGCIDGIVKWKPASATKRSSSENIHSSLILEKSDVKSDRTKCKPLSDALDSKNLTDSKTGKSESLNPFLTPDSSPDAMPRKYISNPFFSSSDELSNNCGVDSDEYDESNPFAEDIKFQKISKLDRSKKSQYSIESQMQDYEKKTADIVHDNTNPFAEDTDSFEDDSLDANNPFVDNFDESDITSAAAEEMQAPLVIGSIPETQKILVLKTKGDTDIQKESFLSSENNDITMRKYKPKKRLAPNVPLSQKSVTKHQYSKRIAPQPPEKSANVSSLKNQNSIMIQRGQLDRNSDRSLRGSNRKRKAPKPPNSSEKGREMVGQIDVPIDNRDELKNHGTSTDISDDLTSSYCSIQSNSIGASSSEIIEYDSQLHITPELSKSTSEITGSISQLQSDVEITGSNTEIIGSFSRLPPLTKITGSTSKVQCTADITNSLTINGYSLDANYKLNKSNSEPSYIIAKINSSDEDERSFNESKFKERNVDNIEICKNENLVSEILSFNEQLPLNDKDIYNDEVNEQTALEVEHSSSMSSGGICESLPTDDAIAYENEFLENLKAGDSYSLPPPRLQCKIQSTDRRSSLPDVHNTSVEKRKAPAKPPQQYVDNKRTESLNISSPSKPLRRDGMEKELQFLEVRQRELEMEGVIMEKKLRDCRNGEPEDAYLLTWFELVNQKNQLLRRENELIYMCQEVNYLHNQRDAEFELRQLMMKSEIEKTEDDILQEEKLISEILSLVTKRSNIVEQLDKDRLRENEEDLEIFSMMAAQGMKSQNSTAMYNSGAENRDEVESSAKHKHKENHKSKLKQKKQSKNR